MQGIADLPDPAGKVVLLRLDLNVPLKEGKYGPSVADDFRIVSALPAIHELLERGARVVAVSHLGELDGKPHPAYRMEPVRRYLARLAPEVELQENLRFFRGELTADPGFVRELIRGRDLYVNDAFATAHRAHASIIGPPMYLPSAMGPLMRRELTALGRLVEAPQRPFTVILGGAKIADKLRTLAALGGIADRVLVGGAMANALMAAAAFGAPRTVGAKFQDQAKGGFPDEVLRLCGEIRRRSPSLVLPTDFVVGDGVGPPRVAPADRVPRGFRALDIGPETTAHFIAEIGESRTVFWNGPLGIFENPAFAEGSSAVAHALARSPGFVAIGGGETAQFVRSLGLADQLDHVSSGGGATLHYLAVGDLPALAALRKGPDQEFTRPAAAASRKPGEGRRPWPPHAQARGEPR